MFKPTKMIMAQVHVGTAKHVKAPLFRIDWRSLERNKYAPWGRGANSRLPI